MTTDDRQHEYRGSIIRMTVIAVIIVLIAIFVSGCGVDPKSASWALEAQGMKDVKIEGFSLFGCGKEDAFKSSFSATGANGTRVTGTVCQGFLKGTTVRFD